MVDYSVHRCAVFEFTPRSIQCMSAYEFPEPSKQIIGILAVGRENGAIELLRHTRSGFYSYLTIPGSSERNLEDLLFCNGRLFSAELQGVISEYDLNKGIKKYSEDSFSGAVWCLAAGNGNGKIAAGCEDGSLKIFSCSGELLEFEKSMDRQQGRILCCSFHPNNQFIVAGSVDVIRIWNCQSGHAVQRIRLDQPKTSNIVWDVKMLSDGTIISGDSTGKISFWNGKNATQTNSFQIHKGDVLALCVSDDESTVYAAGVDPRVIALQRTNANSKASDKVVPLGMEAPIKPEAEWVKGSTMQAHSHDVRALVIIGKFLASGGVDTNILLHETKRSPRVMMKKVSPYPHKSIVHFALNTEILLLRYPKHLDVWKIGIAEDTEGSPGDIVQLQQEPIKLCQVKLPSSDPNDIACSAISDCGHWIAYGTCITFKLLWMNWKDEDICQLSISKTQTQWVKSPSDISFCPDSRFCVVSSHNGKIYVMKLNDTGLVHLEHVIKPEEDHYSPSIKIATNSLYLAALDLKDRIKVYSLEKASLKCTLPKREHFPTALSFRPSSNCLFIAYQNHSVIEYDVDAESYTDWCKKAVSAEFNLSEYSGRFSTKPKRSLYWGTAPITHISFPGNEGRKVVFTSHRNSFFMEYSTDIFDKFLSSNKQFYEIVKSARHAGKPLECPVRKYSAFENALMFSFFRSGTSILVVERPWRDIFDELPPTLYVKKYGA